MITAAATMMMLGAQAEAPLIVAEPINDIAAVCLTLEAAVVQALDTAPALEFARADVDAAEADKGFARSRFLPQLSVQSRAGLGDGNLADNQLDNRAGLVASQHVFDFGANRAGLRAARFREEAAQAGLGAAEANVARDAALMFIELMRAQERLAAVTAIEEQFGEEAKGVERMLSRQLIKRSDASGILAERAFAQARQAREELAIADLTAQLEVLLQAEVDCGTPSSIQPYLSPLLPADLETTLTDGVDNAGEIVAARAALRAADQDAVQAARSRLPSLSLNGSYTYDYDPTLDEFREFNRVGVDLQAPLFQGGRGRAAQRSALAERRRAAARLSTVRRQRTEEIRRAWAQVTFLEAAASRQRDAKDSFAVMADAVEREYDRGLTTVPALIDAKRDYFAAVLAEIDTRYELYAAQAMLALRD